MRRSVISGDFETKKPRSRFTENVVFQGLPWITLAFTLLINLLFSSCSTLTNKKTVDGDSEDVHDVASSKLSKEIEKIYENASKRLDVLVAESKKAGGPAVNFLSTDLYLKANDSSIHGDSRTAAFLLKYVLELNPQDVYVQKKYAVELIRLGELKEAQDLLEKVFKDEPHKDENVGLILGGIYTTLDKNKEAELVYKKLLQRFPKSEEACVFLAKNYATSKKFGEANSLLNQCEQRSKGKAIFAYYRGKIALAQDHKEQAKQHFAAALKIDKTYFQAAMGLGLLAEEKEDIKQASKIYKDFLKNNPDNYSVLARLVQTMFAAEMFEEVLPFAEKLASFDPSDVNLKIRLGILYTDARRFEDAKNLFKEVLTSSPENDKILYYLAALHQQTGDFENAYSFYSKVPSSSALFMDSNLQMASLLQAKAQEDITNGSEKGQQAFLDFSKKTGYDFPDLKTELYVNVAGHFEGVDKINDAIEWMEEVSKDEKFTDHHRYFLASLYEKTQNYKRSMAIVEEILARDPKNAHALNFIGYSLLERNEDMERALDLISQAVSLKPDDAYIVDSLGWYYFKTGDYKKALVHIKKAWSLQKDDVVITKHLAQVYMKMQKLVEAEKYFVEALKNCKAESERTDVLKAMEEFKERRLPASTAIPSSPEQ